MHKGSNRRKTVARNDLQPYPVSQSFRLTQEDIDFGVAADSYNCALVRMIQRTIPSAVYVRVNMKEMSWSDEKTDERYFYPTPPRLVNKVIKPFDSGETEALKPISITLTGGQFRLVDHKDRSKSRPADRKRDAQTTDRSSTHWTHRAYERYVPNANGA
jgi:hypothetical protein